MIIEMCTPGGDVEFNVPCLKVQSYTIDEIFEKKLYFLIPFYIFTYESRFQEIDADLEMLSSVLQEYNFICLKLDEALQNGLLTAFVRKSIMEMSEKVLEALAAKYSNIRKGVKSVMGGTVLDYEAKRILNQGRAEGSLQVLFDLVRDGDLPTSRAAKRANMSEDDFTKKMNEHFGAA